jgi:reactive intermediate/imine deaminase
MKQTGPSIQTYSVKGAPKPLGNYSHAVGFGDLIFVSGIASRDFETDVIPGLMKDQNGNKARYDIKAETRATLKNIAHILKEVGSDLEHVLEVNTYLLNMNDFKDYNEVYAEHFSKHRPARTTIGVASLPGDVSIEMRVVAVKK